MANARDTSPFRRGGAAKGEAILSFSSLRARPALSLSCTLSPWRPPRTRSRSPWPWRPVMGEGGRFRGQEARVSDGGAKKAPPLLSARCDEERTRARLSRSHLDGLLLGLEDLGVRRRGLDLGAAHGFGCVVVCGEKGGKVRVAFRRERGGEKRRGEGEGLPSSCLVKSAFPASRSPSRARPTPQRTIPTDVDSIVDSTSISASHATIQTCVKRRHATRALSLPPAPAPPIAPHRRARALSLP